MIPRTLDTAQLLPVPAGEKALHRRGWPEIRPPREEVLAHLARGGNVAMRLGKASGDVVDADLDSPEALALAPIYLPPTQAIFGRKSKPQSHRLYHSPGAVYASFADPIDGTMLAELRADGRDGGAHLTLIPPSTADGERRAWHGEAVEPAEVESAVLARRMTWLAIGCLTLRHLSEHAARRPGPDLPAVLWEADHTLGRAAYRWLGEPAPDAPRQSPKPRSAMTCEEIGLAEIVAGIPNGFDWVEWNRIGMAIYVASGGSEEGWIAFDGLSARSPKYDPYVTRQRWNNFRRSPPSRVGIGTLIFLARSHGWRRGGAA